MRLFDFLKESSARYPSKEAVVCLSQRMDYAALDRYSDCFASGLAARGLGKGDRVALFLDNSCEYAVSYFAALKAGACVAALNTQMVPRELEFVLSDCAPKAIITEPRLKNIVDAARENIAGGLPEPRVVSQGEDVEKNFGLNGEALEAARSSVSENDLAVMIYTSGTTGRPKGVMLSHRNMCSNAESIVSYLKLSHDDSAAVVLPFFYSYGTSLLTTHIKAGGKLVIDNRFLYPNTVLDTMEREGVTGFSGVPSHFAILLRKSALRNYKLPKLRYVTQAGGAMSPSHIREFREILPKVEFFVMYGQTEAAARLSYLPPRFLESKLGSVGKAIPGVELSVVGENGKAAVPGEIGEIVARGDNIMLGYWKSPEETAKVLKDGFLYTGDLARTDDDGFIYIASRKSDMIKSGANRISPLEIEDAVCMMKEVLECAAVGVPDEIFGESIKLVVVLREGASVSEKDILIFCKKNLAAYKVPKTIVLAPALPKTASGKVKRAELR